ncbi:Rh-like protein/ammonium transporter [Aspergillus granulosus]|uniref:Rh-like protein/ammonium transporter n=1 Tax=Aspergillus granulosus TaxID=176169 RepID=A0ABR4I5A0_9EURO
MTGRHAPRSKNGCTTCRRRKVKCGEERPVCIRCSSLQLVCDWGATARRAKPNAAIRYIQPATPRWSESSAASTASDGELSQISHGTPILGPAVAFPQFVQNIPSFESLFPDRSFPAPLYPSLSESGVACANSLVLSERDQEYFQYFPSSSLVFYYIKNWQWSGFRYLYQGPAIASKLIMRMVLALSASDMHRKGLAVRLPGHPTAEDHGRYHYGRAVKEFRQLLETPRESVSQAELETIFATMFLMICYEWQFGESVQDIQLHLRGVRSLLESHPRLFENKDVDRVLMSMDLEPAKRPRVSFIPEQFLLWILYIDSGCRTVGMTDSLYDFVLRSGNPSLNPDRLYRCARLWGRCFWGQQYPDQEVSDDIENYRALELLHTAMIFRHKIWQAFSEDPTQTGRQADLVWSQIMTSHEQFSDLFLTAKLARATSTRRTLITIYMAVSLFYAHALFHRRLLCPPGPPSNFHRLAVTNIIEITKKQYEADPQLMRRLHWPLLMAAIETEDKSYREWLQDRLTSLHKMSVLSAWESCDKTDTLFILVCSVFCWLIIPAVGLAYSGYSTRFNSLASFYPGLLAVAVCSLQWWMIGYSLAYSEGNALIGDLSKAFHIGVLAEPVGTIPEVLFSEFQLIFCATVCAIAIGGACERGRLLPLIPFIFLWSTFIYAPLAHMVWTDNGFLARLGTLDFAGGTPVHICSGATATAMSIYLSYPIFRSRRSTKRTPQHLRLHKPHNSLCQLLALIIIWNAWLAFDAGTTLALNFKSVMAACVTNLCAASGALTWAGITYWETGKFSLDSTFLGAIAGLVLITPSAGFIDLNTSVAFGVVGALAGRQALRIKFTKRAALHRWVDNGDTFATHCLGGLLGTLATGLFAQREVAAYDGETIIAGGCVFDGNWRQLGVQLVEALIGFTWSFVGSYVLYALIDCVPGLEVLATDEDIITGMDASQMDESLHEAQWAGEEDYHPFHSEIQL